MKKAIKRFWGIGLIVIILSSLLVAPATVSGGNYAFTVDTTQPTVTNRILAPAAGFGITDIDQSADGTAIYITGMAGATKYLYKSTNGGTSWSPCNATGATGATTWDLVAVAPDNGALLVIVDKTTNIVYISTNSGATFSSLGVPGAGAMIVNDVDMSVQSGTSRYIAAAGNVAGVATLYVWAYGSTVPVWYDIVNNIAASPAWTPLGGANEDVKTVAFSTSFASDQSVLFVTEDTNVSVSLHVGSFNIRKFDNNVDATFPRVLEANSVADPGLACAKADIVLDPAFYLGDEATQIGFIGADIQTTALTQRGGVYRTTYSFTGGVYNLSQIMDGTAIGSLAYDGTNLVAAPYTTANAIITIYRSTNPLATASGVTFLPSSTAKTPSTGFGAKVVFNGTSVLCVSQGNNAGVAKSADMGKSFNGIALLNTNLNTVLSLSISPDTKTIYMLTDDGVDVNVWRFKDNAWQRIDIISAGTGATWILRASASDPTAVVLGLKGGANMFISINGGETSWTARSSSTTIQDFVVETKDIIYVAGTTTSIVKSTNGAFTWGPPTNTNINLYGGGNLYSMTLVSAGNIVVGGTAGGVAYSSDSGATWTGLQPLTAGGNVLAGATGLATGETIFAASSTAVSAISKWKIGTNAPPSNWTDTTATLATGADGLVYINGILYVLDNTSNVIKRFRSPLAGPWAATDTIAEAGTYATDLNALLASTGSVTLWAINSVAAPCTLDSWTEYLATAADAPKQVFPTDNYMLQVNSLSGNPNNFVFQWSSPPAVSTTVTYNYDIAVYLDAAGLVAICGPVATGATSASTVSVSAATIVFTPIPGTTYYWRVRVRADNPVQSAWSTMRTLTVQPLAASVPTVSSPANGATILNQSPAFSWSPVTSTTKYEFQLSTTPTFGTTVLTDTPSTAGALVPVTIKLEQGKQYFWRVRALEPVQGDWSTVANFVVAVPASTVTAPPIVVTQVPAPIITIPAPAPAPTYTLNPPAEEVIAPTYIWAIIIIGAILVIAVIVLIVRTRRSV